MVSTTHFPVNPMQLDMFSVRRTVSRLKCCTASSVKVEWPSKLKWESEVKRLMDARATKVTPVPLKFNWVICGFKRDQLAIELSLHLVFDKSNIFIEVSFIASVEPRPSLVKERQPANFRLVSLVNWLRYRSESRIVSLEFCERSKWVRDGLKGINQAKCLKPNLRPELSCRYWSFGEIGGWLWS